MTANKMKKGGFTLLETMVAIAILLIAVVGPISVIGDSLRQIYFARDQVTAINLAQEGIEAVRQVRDTNMLSSLSWDNGFGNSFCASGGYQCIIDTNPLAVIKCNGLCSNLNQDAVYVNPAPTGDGLYHQYYSAPIGVATNFHRLLVTNKITNDEYMVTSTVTWKTGGMTGSVSVSENIFKWAL